METKVRLAHSAATGGEKKENIPNFAFSNALQHADVCLKPELGNKGVNLLTGHSSVPQEAKAQRNNRQ